MSHLDPSSPLSLDDIIADAELTLNAQWNPNIPLRYYLRSADAITKQAQSYSRDGNQEKAFEFYYKHAILVMQKLTKHPEAINLTQSFKKSGFEGKHGQKEIYLSLQRAKQIVEGNLRRMEDLKPILRARYKTWHDTVQKRRDEFAKHEAETYNTRHLDPSMNADYAVKLAHNEFRGAGLQEHEAVLHNKSLGHRGTFFKDDSDDDIASQIKAVGERREQSLNQQSIPPTSSPQAHLMSTFQYPSVPKHSQEHSQAEPTSTSWYSHTPTRSNSPRLAGPTLSPPMKPPKELLSSASDVPDVPDVPSKIEQVVAAENTMDPRKYTFMAAATTEDGKPLRTLFINPELRSRFLTIALANTHNNLETCGILCGKLLSNAFFVSKLVIPEQESTSDTCDTVNEGALFDYCDKENLMTLGWIHTHPTQTCFMSSRDLHTHGGYQVQLAESIAIVCAPRHEPSWGCFRLTDPPGLGAILNCKQTGLFHPHQEHNIYTDALMPGHVKEVENLPFDVVDLRPGSSWI